MDRDDVSVRWRANVTPDALLISLGFTREPDPAELLAMKEIAEAWGTLGRYGSFGGAAKQFEGAFEFLEPIYSHGPGIWFESVVDLGTMPVSGLDPLVTAWKRFARLMDSPLEAIELGED
jgi:hypothetical protein